MTENQYFNQIKEVIDSKKIAIFMKGSPDFPQCGFSHQAIQALVASGVSVEELAFFDVLSDENIRSAVKEFSNWPTIPQVYVNGQFIGGCDIIMEMHQSGELQKLIQSQQN